MSHFSSYKAPERKLQHDTASSMERERSPKPSSLAQDILALQRTAGNQVVTHLLQRAQHNSSPSAPVSGVPTVVNDVLRSAGQPLDDATRAFMEPRFGHDFSQVRVHTDAQAAESARAVNALAYTVGTDIMFGAEQYTPTTHEGQRLIAHELVHTIQQRQNSKAAPCQTSLDVSRPGDTLEQEANAIANQIMTGESGHVQSATRANIARQEGEAKTTTTTGTPSSKEWNYDPGGLLDDPQVNAQFKAAAKKALAAAVAGGLKPQLAEAYRSPEESERKYKAYKSGKGGRAAPAWQSIHNYGLGMDVYLLDADGEMIDSDNAKKHPDWYKQVKKFANTYMGEFVWGEPIGDTDHFEYHPKWSGLASGAKLIATRDSAQKAASGKTDYSAWIDYFWWLAGAGGKEPPGTTTKAVDDTKGKEHSP